MREKEAKAVPDGGNRTARCPLAAGRYEAAAELSTPLAPSFSDQHTARPSVVTFYNQRGTAEQWIREGKGAIRWTRLSCRSFTANAVRLQLHALAYNLGNFLRTLATPEPIKDRSLTSLKEKLIKIGAKVVTTAAMSPSRWPRLPCRGRCSPRFCG